MCTLVQEGAPGDVCPWAQWSNTAPMHGTAQAHAWSSNDQHTSVLCVYKVLNMNDASSWTAASL